MQNNIENEAATPHHGETPGDGFQEHQRPEMEEWVAKEMF